jgi:hypothetical protein
MSFDIDTLPNSYRFHGNGKTSWQTFLGSYRGLPLPPLPMGKWQWRSGKGMPKLWVEDRQSIPKHTQRAAKVSQKNDKTVTKT